MAPRSESASMNPSDLPLDQLRLALAPRVAAAAIFDGWTDAALASAAVELGVAGATARIAFPDGAMDMIDAWIETIDARMLADLPPARLGNLSIRERIRTLVEFRFDTIAGLEEALRRAQTVMALPGNLRRSAQLGWRSADRMWRLAGDTAMDWNHYTKRATLGSIYAATMLVFVDDESGGKADTRAFLARRIEGLMRFEKAKARLLKPSGERFSPMRLAGRLRYPPR